MKSGKDWSRKNKIIAGAAAAAVLAGLMFFFFRKGSSAVSYREIIVGRGDIEESILSTGIVQPENRLEIKLPIAGRVDEVLVKEGENVKKGQRLLVMSSSERAALLDAARAKGEAELRRWEGFYKPAPILAPIDGTIILRNVEPGQSFTSADAVLVMSDRLTVKAQVDETDIAKISLKQRAMVVLDAYPDEQVPALVDQIAYDAKTINNVTTYIVDVLPEETPAFMRSGMTANVRFAGQAKTGVLVLPTNAVKNRDGRHFVNDGPDSNHPKDKEVEVGITDGKMVEIVSGIEEGDKVFTVKSKSGGSGQAQSNSNPFSPFGSGKKK
ncbi:MAG: HlyD family efflux transporter periplasmic adaptor subunit [Pseudomonadota bacterium]